jgi:tRNA-dihydrouridine synthase
MSSLLAGGGMFRHPEIVAPLLETLRPEIRGSLSVKTRIGFDDPRQIFELLPAFEAAQVDFLVIHPRTVQQKYSGEADHEITREVVETTTLPVIANGDIRDEARAAWVLEHTGAAGLMLGRGAINDPLLFERIRGRAPTRPTGAARKIEVVAHLETLMARYVELFSGDIQVVSKLKEALNLIDDPELARWIGKLRRTRSIAAFSALLRTPSEAPRER